jgi:hypothetical protein
MHAHADGKRVVAFQRGVRGRGVQVQRKAQRRLRVVAPRRVHTAHR